MKVNIELEIELPEGIKMERALLEEWLEFEMGIIGMREKSPLDGYYIGDITKHHDITITD